MTKRIETKHILNGIIFTLAFYGYDTVSKQLTKSVLEVLEWAAHSLLLPEDIEVRIVKSPAQRGADGVYATGRYTPKATAIAHPKFYTRGDVAHIYTKNITLIVMQECLAHELGHAEHLHMHPESIDWTSPRMETYANTVQAMYRNTVKSDKYFNELHISDDIYVEKGHIHRK